MRRNYIYLIFLFLSLQAAAQFDVDVALIARNLGEKELADSSIIRVFGFAEDLGSHPKIPGPTIWANEGDSVRIDLWNVSQGAPHTIHLHGLDVDQQNDGVPHLSFEIPHMDHGYYYFKAPHAGTYLYHCHVASTVHVQAGMYGLIVIRPSDGSNKTWNDGPTFSKDYSFLMSEIDTIWHQDSVLDHDYDTSHNMNFVQLPYYDPQFFLVNGYSDGQLPEQDIAVRAGLGDTVYLRFANIGFYANKIRFPENMEVRIISSDGRPLPVPDTSRELDIYPGERYGVLIRSATFISDSISVAYFDLNTKTIHNTQFIPLDLYGTHSITDNSMENALDVYPNPGRTEINIRLNTKSGKVTTVQILNTSGMVLEERMLTYSGKLLNIKHELAAGVYFIKVISDGNYLIKKIVVY